MKVGGVEEGVVCGVVEVGEEGGGDGGEVRGDCQVVACGG